MKYELVIGLEIHAELNTRTKMFCACSNDPLEKHPNINICPVCMGHPGTLPVINREAVERVIRVGLALGGSISAYSQFDRKNYFYPDLPKGYQISQYKYPIVSGGMLNGVRITRVHLEEDAGRLQHIEEKASPVSSTGRPATLVDFNRAGVPLLELVTEPDIRFAADARLFAEELRMILRYVNASDADMEKGQMRIEANISVRPVGALEFGTKVEVKNINSFRAVEKAILYEIQRQAELLDAGEQIKQETRGWNDVKEITVPQRSKEEAHDYRYFPEPDLPPLRLTKEQGFDIEMMRNVLPELPLAKRVRFREQYGLPEKITAFFAADKYFADYFEQASSELMVWLTQSKVEGIDDTTEGHKKIVGILASYLSSDLQFLMMEKGADIREVLITPENMAELIKMIYKNEISSRAAKDVLQHMFADGSDPSQIVEEEGLQQVSDTNALEVVARKIITENPKPVADYKTGKQAALQVLVGKIMQETKGSANPGIAHELLIKLLCEEKF